MCVSYNMAGKVFGEKYKGMQQLDDLFQKDKVHNDIFMFAT